MNLMILGLASVLFLNQQENFLTSNHILLGHSSPESLPLEYLEGEKFSQELAYIASVE